MAPIGVAEFNAHKNVISMIVQFLCRNKDNGFSAKEIADSLGLKEEDVNNAMMRLGLSDFIKDVTSGMISKKLALSRPRTLVKIEDVTINGIIYYRCIEKS